MPEALAQARLTITAEAPRGTEIAELIRERLAHSYAHSPPESVHALPLDQLDRPEITFWTARLDGALVGCAALLRHDDGSGELKSMFLRPAARGLGLSKALLEIVEAKARDLQLTRIDLETGADSHAARGLYSARGYCLRDPFGKYKEDPNSVFMTKDLA
ncbi:GNAT family N-acetyltransferase [Taklimakanibacter lacteus]|uniref:GNAT family N-acetyltransferase n=1 Tax=Taklimakanibacter lacteus TaxID=2268456 RepID=UPI0034D539CC